MILRLLFKPNKRKERGLHKDVVEKSLDFLAYLFKIHSIEVNYQNSSDSGLEIFK